MDDRRRHERREAVAPIEILDANTGEVVGLLADISSGGMMLRSERALSPGRTMRLALVLPSGEYAESQIMFEASIRWCEPDLQPGAQVIGLQFSGHTPPAGLVVEELRRQLSQTR